jgi:hypothetical protein
MKDGRTGGHEDFISHCAAHYVCFRPARQLSPMLSGGRAAELRRTAFSITMHSLPIEINPLSATIWGAVKIGI